MSASSPSAAELLRQPEALLSTSHLRELGLPRRAIDAVLRGCPTYHFEGYARPLVMVRDFIAYRETHKHTGETVRPA